MFQQKLMQTQNKQESRTEILSDMQVLSSLKQGMGLLSKGTTSS